MAQLGSRNILWNNYGGKYGSELYSQDGLIFQCDGIENVGRGQHDSTSRVWYDLVNKYPSNAYTTNPDINIFTDNALIGKGINSSLTNNYTQITWGNNYWLPYVTNPFYYCSEMSTEFCAYYVNLNNTQAQIIRLLGSVGSYVNYRPDSFSGCCWGYNALGGADQSRVMRDLNILKFVTISFRTKGAASGGTWNGEVYRNGEIVNSNYYKYTFSKPTNTQIRDGHASNNYGLTQTIGKLFSWRIYLRYLSLDEIRNHCLIDKMRFGGY